MFDRDLVINYLSDPFHILPKTFLHSKAKPPPPPPKHISFHSPQFPENWVHIYFKLTAPKRKWEQEKDGSPCLQLESEAAPLTSGWGSSPPSLWCWQWCCCGRSWHLWERLWIHWCTWSRRCLRAAAAFAHKLLRAPERASLEDALQRDAPSGTSTKIFHFFWQKSDCFFGEIFKYNMLLKVENSNK